MISTHTQNATKATLFVLLLMIAVFSCKEKDTPAPIPKKYVYQRTPGEATKIEGDLFVDTGMTYFTVKGKGFDPKKKANYHLLMLSGYCGTSTTIQSIKGYNFNYGVADTAKLVHITDTSILFWVNRYNIYNTRDPVNGQSYCTLKDTVEAMFAVTSWDSTNKEKIEIRFDNLKVKKAGNQLFFNILRDTLLWHKNSGIRDKAITIEDIRAGGVYGDRVQLYFNNILLNTSSDSPGCFYPFRGNPDIGDGYFIFDIDFYNSNKDLGLTDGFYNITMVNKRTGLPIIEKHRKKGLYVKFVD